MPARAQPCRRSFVAPCLTIARYLRYRKNDFSAGCKRIRNGWIPIVERPGEVLKEEQWKSRAASEPSVRVSFVAYLNELGGRADVTVNFHTACPGSLTAQVVASVPSRVFAQVILVIVLRAVPGGGGLNGCCDRAFPLP